MQRFNPVGATGKLHNVFDWNRFLFLESTTNLKPLVRKLTGRTPSTSLAREITVCLQQGRLFFQSAERSALEIRPLLLFYGTMAFAKGLIASQELISIGTLPQSHGLRDITPPAVPISEMVLQIHRAGTFQRFNDVVARLNRLRWYNNEFQLQTLAMPAAPSGDLADLKIGLKDILSRIPDLGSLYLDTFGEPALNEAMTLH